MSEYRMIRSIQLEIEEVYITSSICRNKLSHNQELPQVFQQFLASE